MKKFKHIIARRATRQTTEILVLAVAALTVTGCGSESSESDLVPTATVSSPVAVALQEPAGMAAAMAPPPGAGSPLAQPAAAAGNPASPFNQPDQGANDQAMAKLNEGLRKFFAQYERAPYTADELVAEKFIESMPQAPAGKEYFYDSVGLRFKLINKRPE